MRDHYGKITESLTTQLRFADNERTSLAEFKEAATNTLAMVCLLFVISTNPKPHLYYPLSSVRVHICDNVVTDSCVKSVVD
jgi:hypothetical protein